MVAGVLQTAANTKLMQLQTSALETLTQLLVALQGKVTLPDTVTEGARRQLTSMTTDIRSPDIKAQAEEALKLLQAPANDTDVSMTGP